MQVSNPNNIKIYNLSAGRSLPEWISDKKKRKLQKDDPELQRRINLIQDFEMPTVSNSVQVTPDQKYLFVSGVYKPRIRVYDSTELSMKFERCTDSEIVKFNILSDDYSKFVLLMHDRYVEFHVPQGRYFRMRIPKYGRDMSYHQASCDMYFVGVSPEIYRINLELGRFMSPLKSQASELNCCEFNPHHQLFACGTKEGFVECWDPRVRQRVGLLDCAVASHVEDLDTTGVPSITSMKYRDALNLAVGTSTGQILLYDIRSSKPLLVKDHNYGLPIKSICFHSDPDLVMSIDTKILKLWHRNNGKPFTAIEPPDTKLNDLCVVPKTGMLFLANEAPKVQSYYIPALGPAPRWCAFLDSLTEELEENPTPTVYDDYKFVTRTELESLGLQHLIGSNLLRGYMHGYFIDMRLYHKAKNLAEPFAYDDYKKTKIREKIDDERSNRVKVNKLPKVNRDLAQKLLMNDESSSTAVIKKKKQAAQLLEDDRFSALFKDTNFQVDTESEEYRLLNPLVSKLDRQKQKKALKKQFEEIKEAESGDGDEELEGKGSSEEDSSDDEHTWTQEMKQQHKQITQERKQKQRAEAAANKPKFFELKAGESLKTFGEQDVKKTKRKAKLALGDRLDAEQDGGIIRQSGSSRGNLEMTFNVKKDSGEIRRKQEMAEHHNERKKIRRSAGTLTSAKKRDPRIWGNRR